MITGRNVDWGGGGEGGGGIVGTDFYPPVSFGNRMIESMDSKMNYCGEIVASISCRRKDRSGRHVNSIEEEDSPFAIIRSSTDRLWD